MMFALVFMKMDYGPMKNFEHKSELKKLSDEIEKRTENEKNAKVFDLIIPIAVLIVMCVISMIYSGGFFSKESENYLNFINSFASSDASVGLVIGSFATLVVSIIYFVLRRLVSFTDAMVCIPEGFKAMVPAMFIPAAEKTNLITEIDDYVLRRAMTEMKPVLEASGKNFVVSINVSAKNIATENFAQKINQMIEEIQFPAENLEIEITEYSFAESNHQVACYRNHTNQVSVHYLDVEYNILPC